MAHTAVAKKQSEPKMSRALVRQETIAGYLFLLPSLIFFIGFVIYPMVMCIFTSFFDSSMNRADVFIGLQNYVELFHDSVFLGALRNTLIIAFFTVLLGFVLGAVVSVVLAVCAARWSAADALLAPVMQLVKATPVASFIILALVWVRGSALSVLISFLMVLPVLYGAVRTGIAGADVQLLEMAAVFRLPAGRRLRAVWLPAVLPAFRQGCSVALGICWKSGVAAEVIGLPNGSIGDALYRAKITLSTGELFAWTFVIILLSAGFEKLFLFALDKAVGAVLGEEGAKC